MDIREKITARVRRRFDALRMAAALEEKWLADTVALDIDPRLRGLHETIHQIAYKNLARFPNLVLPENYNDRIHWLMLFDQDERVVQCSDKLAVREYVRARVGDQYLTRLHAEAATTRELDWATLPPACVIKTNHDSGTVFLVPDKATADFQAIRQRLDASLGRVFASERGEWAYGLIPPRILVEEHLNPTSPIPPPDYKFHCIEGRVSFVQFIMDRGHHPKEAILDPQWRRLPIHFDRHFSECPAAPDRPANLAEMEEVVEALAKGFKYVRVDVYNLAGRVVFGEMTFFPTSGTYHGYGAYQLGPYMQFDLLSRKPPISDGAMRLDVRQS